MEILLSSVAGEVHEVQIVLIFGPLSSLQTQPWSEFLWDPFWDLKEAWHGWQLFSSVGSYKI